MSVLYRVVFLVVLAGCPLPNNKPPPPSPGSGSELHTLSWEFQNCQLTWVGKPTGETKTECYHANHWRDVSPLTTCRPGEERNGALCYPACREGYKGNGPMCWKACPAGYREDPFTCWRDLEIKSADVNKCPWSDRCGLWHDCSICPEGYRNDGCTCVRDASILSRDSYGRGVGTPMICAQGREQIGALCYGSCPGGTHTNGIYCTDDKETCNTYPVKEPPDNTQLEQYYFRQEAGLYCATWVTYADTQEHADQLAKCHCENCTTTKITADQYLRGCSP
jgi:hypothetical protein